MHFCETIVSSIKQPDEAGEIFKLATTPGSQSGSRERLVLEREKRKLRGPEAACITHLHCCSKCSHQRGSTCRLSSLQ